MGDDSPLSLLQRCWESSSFRLTTQSYLPHTGFEKLLKIAWTCFFVYLAYCSQRIMTFGCAIKRIFAGILLLCGTISTSLAETKHFTLVVTREVLFGHTKLQVAVNGTVPGPTLTVTLGDSVVVNVINHIYNDATTIHWHGMSMRGTPWSDGIINSTQCPISNVPGNNSLEYTFTPDRAGTFWYHGHYHEQQQDGLYGTLIVLDNAYTKSLMTAAGIEYAAESEEWLWQVADWYDVPAGNFIAALLAKDSGAEDPVPDAYTVNNQLTGNFHVRGALRNETTRVRVVHSGSHSYFTVSIDGMPLTIIELDGVAIEPLVVPSFRIAVAQRVSFLLDWSLMNDTVADSPSVWLRFIGDQYQYPQFNPDAPNYGLFGTASGKALNLEWKGLISFHDTVDDDGLLAPSYLTPPVLDLAAAPDVNMLQARPLIQSRAPDPAFKITALLEFGTVDGFTRGYLNGATAHMSGERGPFTIPRPQLFSYITERGGPHMEPNLDGDIIQGSGTEPFVLPYNEVIEVLINGACCGDHPFHLHGHHFWVVDASDNQEAADKYRDNYLVRDVVMVPFGGWARIRFVSDNPGVWWFHCHLHWHLEIGLMAIFIEAPKELQRGAKDGTLVIPQSDLNACVAPKAYSVRTSRPSREPSPTLSLVPTRTPSESPSAPPTFRALTRYPSQHPTTAPSTSPSAVPSTSSPTQRPSLLPTEAPSTGPTQRPTTFQPSSAPTPQPTQPPSEQPSDQMTEQPSSRPSAEQYTNSPTDAPTAEWKTMSPTASSSTENSANPFSAPTTTPSETPSTLSLPCLEPSNRPHTSGPSGLPTTTSTSTQRPSSMSSPTSRSPSTTRPTTHKKPSQRPSQHPASTLSPSLVVGEVSFHSALTVTNIKHLMELQLSQVRWSVVLAVAEILDLPDTQIQFASNSNISSFAADASLLPSNNAVQRQLISLNDLTESVLSVVISVSTTQFPQYRTPYDVYVHLANALSQSVSHGNASEVLTAYLAEAFSPSLVHGVEVLSVSHSAPAVTYPATSPPTTTPVADDDTPLDDFDDTYLREERSSDREMSERTMAIVISTSIIGAIVVTFFCCGMARHHELLGKKEAKQDDGVEERRTDLDAVVTPRSPTSRPKSNPSHRLSNTTATQSCLTGEEDEASNNGRGERGLSAEQKEEEVLLYLPGERDNMGASGSNRSSKRVSWEFSDSGSCNNNSPPPGSVTLNKV